MQKEPVSADAITARKGKTNYPEPFAGLMAGRCKRRLGDYFGLKNFGINMTSLDPGAISALSHHHSEQDEFIVILSGEAVLVLGEKEHRMHAGDCIGLPAGTGIGHQLVNRSRQEVVYLEIGDRSPADKVAYPNDDIRGAFVSGHRWIFAHKDGTPYE